MLLPATLFQILPWNKMNAGIAVSLLVLITLFPFITGIFYSKLFVWVLLSKKHRCTTQRNIFQAGKFSERRRVNFTGCNSLKSTEDQLFYFEHLWSFFCCGQQKNDWVKLQKKSMPLLQRKDYSSNNICTQELVRPRVTHNGLEGWVVHFWTFVRYCSFVWELWSLNKWWRHRKKLWSCNNKLLSYISKAVRLSS